MILLVLIAVAYLGVIALGCRMIATSTNGSVAAGVVIVVLAINSLSFLLGRLSV